ncbi:MAG TPA: hypothetical protein VL242_40220 [Sorangium sp.]|nr:hypothetical protein [Sorangium sp.]
MQHFKARRQLARVLLTGVLRRSAGHLEHGAQGWKRRCVRRVEAFARRLYGSTTYLNKD